MEYEIPPLEEVLIGLRQAGGRFRKYLRRNFEKNHREAAMLDILQMIEDADEKTKQEFENIRHLSKKASLIEAEDSLTSLVKTGRADSMKAIQTSLKHLNAVRTENNKDSGNLDAKLEEWS